MVQIIINLSEEILSARRKSPQEFGKEMRLAAAIFWYQHDLQFFFDGRNRQILLNYLT